MISSKNKRFHIEVLKPKNKELYTTERHMLAFYYIIVRDNLIVNRTYVNFSLLMFWVALQSVNIKVITQSTFYD